MAPDDLTAARCPADPGRVRRIACWIVAGAVAVPVVVPQRAAAKDKSDPEAGFVDPRRRKLPRRHRFRLGAQLGYMRLTSASDGEETQRYHYVPLAADVAYQLQFAKYLMLRPSFAFGANVGNSSTATNIMVHPQFHTGYQGAIFGAAIGYGWFTPLLRQKDAISEIRNDLGQPLITNNHHVDVELSITTRIDRGALSFQLRLGGVSTRTEHFDINNRRWRFLGLLNVGWYFGDGKKQAKRRAERQRRRRARKTGSSGAPPP